MFYDNKYTRWYFNIIDNRKKNIPDGYFEKHHIIPKCLGGSNDKNNLVKLTAREHFICHLLLTKMNDNYKLKFALHMMLVKNDKQDIRYKCNSKIYEYVKWCNSNAASLRNKGIANNKGRKRYYNKITLEEKFFQENDEVDLNIWIKGSIKNKKSKNKGKIYFHDGNGNVKSFDSIKDAPEGWIKGNPNADTSKFNNLKGSSYYYCPATGDESRFNENKIPEGWIKGRSKIWINNGKIIKQHNKINPIPVGWVRGKFGIKGKIND